MAADLRTSERLLILDGGMGTTLEDDFQADISSALWSSVLLSTEDGCKTLEELHRAFLRAGAQLLLTCTYQSSFEGYAKAGFDRDVAIRLVRQAVSLTHNTIQSFPHSSSTSASPPQVILSLSCFGATVGPPGEEYTGRYPVPYGPPSSTTAADSLCHWHFERLKVFAEDPKTWSQVQGIAFETLPLLSEAKAIRKAMKKLRSWLRERGNDHWSGWWISFVFPDGKLPEEGTQPGEIVPTLFSTSNDEGEVPSGVGINCTKMHHLPRLVEIFEQSLRDMDCEAPWLVLYPDGGLTYDPTSRTWHSNSGSLNPAETWARDLSEIGRKALNAQHSSSNKKLWSKVILGGCCKADPSYIAALSAKFRESQMMLG